MELRQGPILPQLCVFFGGFDILLEFLTLNVGKAQLHFGGEDVELIIAFILVDELARYGF